MYFHFSFESTLQYCYSSETTDIINIELRLYSSQPHQSPKYFLLVSRVLIKVSK